MAQHSTIDTLISSDFMSTIEASVDRHDIDNLSVEVADSQVHHFLIRRSHSSIPALDDMFALWAISRESREYGEWELCSVEDDSDAKQRRNTGGGGVARAFFSKMYREPRHRLEDGRCCFASIWQVWKRRKDDETDPLVIECRELCAQATLAHQALQDRVGNIQNSVLSSFGTVQRQKQQKCMEIDADRMMLLDLAQ